MYSLASCYVSWSVFTRVFNLVWIGLEVMHCLCRTVYKQLIQACVTSCWSQLNPHGYMSIVLFATVHVLLWCLPVCEQIQESMKSKCLAFKYLPILLLFSRSQDHLMSKSIIQLSLNSVCKKDQNQTLGKKVGAVPLVLLLQNIKQNKPWTKHPTLFSQEWTNILYLTSVLASFKCKIC